MKEVANNVIEEPTVGKRAVAAVVSQDEDGPHHGPLQEPIDRVDNKALYQPRHGQRSLREHNHGGVERGHDGEILEDIIEGEGEGRREAVGREGLLQLPDARDVGRNRWFNTLFFAVFHDVACVKGPVAALRRHCP